MNPPRDRGTVFALSFVVAFAWYLAFFGVLGIGIMTLPAGHPPEPCSSFGCTLSPREVAIFLAVVYGVPAFAISLMISLAILTLMPLARVGRPLLIGNLAGLLPALSTILVLVGLMAYYSDAGKRTAPEPAPKVTHCVPVSGGHSCPGG